MAGNGSLSGFNFDTDKVLPNPLTNATGGFTHKYENHQMGGKKHKKHYSHHRTHHRTHHRMSPRPFSSKSKSHSFTQSIRSRTKSRSKSTLRLDGGRSRKSRRSRKYRK